MGERRYKHWGWGYADQAVEGAALAKLGEVVRETLGFGGEPAEPAPLELGAVPKSRLRAPSSLAEMVSDDPYERLVRAMGKAYRDVVRGFYGQFAAPPDLIARPSSVSDVENLLAWAEAERAIVIPFGGGTSVVGGVEARLNGGDERGVICLDMRKMDRVQEIDPVSLAARIEAGAIGPRIEEQLWPHGLTLRFYPQSFEFSTLGGWIATRAGGHFATGPTHIEDSIQSLRAVTPRGIWESRRLPGSGAGPSPDRLIAGSEGVLGIVCDAWMRLLERPRFKASATVRFPTGGDQQAGAAAFLQGAEAVRALVQTGLPLANCRLIDPLEARTTGAGDGSAALLLLGAESASVSVGGLMSAAIEIARDKGGQIEEQDRRKALLAGDRERFSEVRSNPVIGADTESPVDQWRSAFLGAPFLRDTLVACGVLSETFETAITWDRFADFHAEVSRAAIEAVAAISGAPADGQSAPRISCRLTHLYRDGAALYYTVLAPAARGGEVEQWDQIKAAVSEAILASGGSITHHHAVGRDHRPYYDRQRPDLFAQSLAAAKREIDPAGMLNPGVLIDPL